MHEWTLSPDLQVQEIAPLVWMHTSWRTLEGGVRLPSNGLIVADGAQLFLVDTAWGSSLTEQLLSWIDQALRLPIAQAVITHFHDDRMGGTSVLAARGVPFVGHALTGSLGVAAGVPLPEPLGPLEIGQATTVGPLEVFYPGPGHTRDNLVVWIGKSRLLFGGCAVRPKDTPSLGNTADADVVAWPTAIRRTQARYPNARIVVPSHGPVGDATLLAHTLELFNAQKASDTVEFRSQGERYRIVTGTLEVQSGTPAVTLSEPLGARDGVTDFIVTSDRATWEIPSKKLRVEARVEAGRLHLRLESPVDQRVAWPRVPRLDASDALVLPIAEGLYVPVTDRFWRSQFLQGSCRTAYGGMSMPFWGVAQTRKTWTYILASDIGSRVCLDAVDEQLRVRAEHSFRAHNGETAYEVVFAPSDSTPIGPALSYRKWLVDQSVFTSLKEKMARRPNVQKLLGAVHVYLWGDGRSRSFVDKLAELGVDRALLAYDDAATDEKQLMKENVAKYAVSRGYLIAPYDTLENIQDPKTADSRSSIFDEELFLRGVVLNEDGTRRKGFHGRGFDLSSEALRTAKTPFLKQRVEIAQKLGANAYFLDVDAYGDFHVDTDPEHRMTRARDRDNRTDRMRYITEHGNFVLGSESAAAWSVPVVDYSHGTQTIDLDPVWALLNSRKRFGGYWPPERPGMFFKELSAPTEFATAIYDPAYRIPLYETVFHDSIVAVDRWEMSLVKFTNLIQVRSLMTLLYGVPTLWNLDRKALRIYGPRLRELYRFFSPIHRRIASLPLMSFEWLSSDRMIQRARFGDALELTANFSQRSYESLAPMCIRTKWTGNEQSETYCPSR